MERLQGQLLVASSRQLDPNFCKTVILVVEHDEKGAFGLIINRPTSRIISVARPCLDEEHAGLGSRLNLGGPVVGPLMAVHTDRSLAEVQIAPGLFFSADRRHLARLLRQGGHHYRIFGGYAGWGPRQLDHEVQRGVWLTAPATAAHVFAKDERLWEGLLRQHSESVLRVVLHITHFPQDPLLN
jgi:putative transcriptional regulator